MKILLIRHGDPDYEHDSLTEKGWREAEQLSQRLIQLPVRDFYVSPLGRAQATAGVTLQKLGRTAETLDWLREFHGRIVNPMQGNWRIPWDLMPLYWTRQDELYDVDRWTENGLYQTGDVEKIYREMAQGVDELLARYGYRRKGRYYEVEPGGGNEDTLVLFCHFGISAAILSYLIGTSPLVLWQGMFFAPTSVTTVVTEERMPGIASFRCIGAGDVSHLYAGGEPMSRSGLFEETAKK
ncbi:MAG: histidine phosphatase family protein [Eubacteriales bacterium]|nr:histidine phosphatase family protein [Eubacteriales bacterium]